MGTDKNSSTLARKFAFAYTFFPRNKEEMIKCLPTTVAPEGTWKTCSLTDPAFLGMSHLVIG